MSENRTTLGISDFLSDQQIGHWVRIYRKAAGLSQQQVARILDCPRSAVSLIESGGRKLTAAEALLLVFHRPEPSATDDVRDLIGAITGRS